MSPDRATIDIDCGHGVVTINTHTDLYVSNFGQRAISLSKSELIIQCLAPKLQELMGLTREELQERALDAMGIGRPR